MNNEIIEALKKNDRGWYALSGEEKRYFYELHTGFIWEGTRLGGKWLQRHGGKESASGFCVDHFEGHSDALEVTKQELPYLQNRPEVSPNSSVVLKKVERGDMFLSNSGVWCRLHEDVDEAFLQGYRWVVVADKNTDTCEEVKGISLTEGQQINTTTLRKALNEMVDKLEADNE